jgi:hypothetical protein
MHVETSRKGARRQRPALFILFAHAAVLTTVFSCAEIGGDADLVIDDGPQQEIADDVSSALDAGVGGGITNGGFESGSGPWTYAGQAFWQPNGSYPRTGVNYAYLGNANSTTGDLRQQFVVSSSATSARLSFWMNIQSSETTTSTVYDRLYVDIINSTGSVRTLATYSNLNKRTAGSYVQSASWDLAALGYRGQTVTLRFYGTNDSTLPTVYRIDDVALVQTASTDAGTTPDAGVDGGVKPDAGVDGGVKPDAGVDGGVKPDAGVDGGTPDAGTGGATAIRNGGFEGTSVPWAFSGYAFYSDNGAYPRSGVDYAYLGNANSVTGSMSQSFTVTSSSRFFGFYYNVVSNETTTSVAYDKCRIDIVRNSDGFTRTLGTMSNLHKGTSGVYKFSGWWDLSSLGYMGQSVSIRFVVSTDSSALTVFRVDDVLSSP